MRGEVLESKLSPRDLEVLALVAEGHENGQIAELLFISPHTVKHHVHTICEKRAIAGAPPRAYARRSATNAARRLAMTRLGEMVREVFRATEARDYDRLAEFMTPDCDFVAPGFSGRGPEPAIAWMAPFMDAFPDIRHEIGPVAERDTVVAFELRITGTHTAPLRGPDGELPPTGRPLDLAAANVWRVDDGRIAAYHIYFDQMSFLGQMGLAPEPTASA